MIRRTKEYILENKMIKNHSTVLVALSGGADSVCLLLLLNEIKRQCTDEIDFALEAVHVEHGIRGAESREDARFASDLCERLNIPCHVHSVDVPQYAKSHGLGLEEAARILRYEAFEEEAGRYPCETAYAADQKQGNSRQAVVAVAHHMEDNAETVLFQMLRGSGAKGLAGMHPVSVKNGVTYIRPLLSATRAQIEEYLKENGQAFVTDATNTDTAYSRNKLRHDVFPLLLQINDRAIEHINESAGQLAVMNDFYEEQLKEACDSMVSKKEGRVILEISRFESLHPALKSGVARECIHLASGRLKDITSTHIGALVKLAGQQSGRKINLPYGIIAEKSFGEVILFAERCDDEKEEIHKLDTEKPMTCEATKELDGRDAEWRASLRKAMKPKERMAIPRVKMNELDAEYRSHSRKEEVNRGLTEEQALTEAKRCLDCANPGCMEGCPVGIDIPRFIKNIERGEFLEAAKTLKETSALPAVCGRVCPQEKQCESKCIHLKMNEKPVAIGYLERFAADYERESGQISVPEIKEKNGIKIAVIGSGPAGLSFAGDMAKYGYDVTVFEALHEIGGVLKYGIPEFRLPNKIVDVEIENLAQMGVKFIKDCIIGKTLSVEQLEEEGFRGIFVASGAGLPNFMNIPGENSINILSSNEYLTRVNLMDAASEDSDTPVPFGKCVAVIGGGNTAMDSVRTARRLGAERAMIIYRRSEEEMPARIEEVKHAKEEGVEFLTLHNPIEYIADEQGKVKQVVLQKMELGEPDASGRRSPVPIPEATETIDIDLAIVSVGVSPNPIVPSSIKGLELGRKGTIAVNDNMQSSIPTIYAGGDIVRGGATVILAMGDGRKAAAAMNEQLKN